MKPIAMDTLSEAIRMIEKKGYDTEFKAEENGLKALTTGKVYSPSDFTIEAVHRFEGDTDVNDMSVLYSVREKDGVKGWIVDAYGPYASERLSKFIGAMKMERQ